jgi:hypothetical protein
LAVGVSCDALSAKFAHAHISQRALQRRCGAMATTQLQARPVAPRRRALHAGGARAAAPPAARNPAHAARAVRTRAAPLSMTPPPGATGLESLHKVRRSPARLRLAARTRAAR